MSGQVFVATAGNSVIRSTDGVEWSTHEVTDEDTHLENIKYIWGEFIIPAMDGTYWYSEDGTEWYSQTIGTTWALTNVVFDDATEQTVYVSSDGYIISSP